jgi:hypothetical protein
MLLLRLLSLLVARLFVSLSPESIGSAEYVVRAHESLHCRDCVELIHEGAFPTLVLNDVARQKGRRRSTHQCRNQQGAFRHAVVPTTAAASSSEYGLALVPTKQSECDNIDCDKVIGGGVRTEEPPHNEQYYMQALVAITIEILCA